ncbi:MAG: carbon starvation CstA family protein [Candidatus Hydrogenedentota bacterium]
MNVLLVLIPSIVIFYLASRFYAVKIENSLGIDPQKPTPSVRLNDGKDYCPTKTYILFAHHFSMIAGAGPILGPTLAAIYGYLPSVLWIILGGIFIGAVHDFSTLFLSIREDGRSIAEIAKKYLGNTGFFLFISFTLLMLFLVTSAFLRAASVSLTSMYPLDRLGLTAEQTLLNIVEKDNIKLGVIGGIASTSVIIITLMSPLLGYLLYKKGISKLIAYIIAFLIAIISIVLGFKIPVSIDLNLWMVILSIYVWFASTLPVWLILQPRDFINVQILYGGIILLLVSLFIGGIKGISLGFPAFSNQGIISLGYLWPMLFITVACGAISGFHAIVASGTPSKQISTESDAKKIGYNGMLLESILALCVVLTICSSLNQTEYINIVWASEKARQNPILAFALSSGFLFNNALGINIALGCVLGILLVEGFVITTLDAAIRITRYIFEELWRYLFPGVKFLQKMWFNSLLAVVIMFLLAYKNAFNALWPIFGTGNQLLAALTLITITVFLLTTGRKFIFALLPAIFMFATTITALIILLKKYYLDSNYILISADIILLFLALGVVVIFIRKIEISLIKKRSLK